MRNSSRRTKRRPALTGRRKARAGRDALDVLKFHRLAAVNAAQQSNAGMLPGRIGGLLTTVRVTREGAEIAQTADL